MEAAGHLGPQLKVANAHLPPANLGAIFLKRMTRMLAGIRGCSAPFLRSCENFGMAQTRRA